MCVGKMVNEEIKTFKGYIYKITNTETRKVYIGQTRTSINRRFKDHLNSAFRSTSSSYRTKLARSIRKHGTDRFIIEQIKEITASSLGILCKELDKEERYYIEYYKSIKKEYGYNILDGGQYKYYTPEEIEISIRNKTSFTHCTIPGCNNEHKANGLCTKHYTQMRKFGYIKERTIMDKNEIVCYDDHAEIILYNKKCEEIARTKIDLDDIDKIKDIKWCYSKQSRGEHVHSSNPTAVLHNFILNHTDKTKVVMHKNGDNLDNRKENLMVVSQKEKQQNHKTQSNNKSGVPGVWWCKDRFKWQAQITIDNKTKSLGRFWTFEEAVAARKAAEKIYYSKWEESDQDN